MQVRKELHDLPNVYSTGFGPREIDGQPVTEGPTHLIVFVLSKVARDELDESDLVPETVNGVPTDVQQTELFEPHLGTISGEGSPIRSGASWPVNGGVYVSTSVGLGLGSSSALLRDESGTAVILTNRHVADQSADTDPTGADFEQGETYNSETDSLEPRVVGTISEVGAWDPSAPDNTVDTAIASVTASECSPAYLGLVPADDTASTLDVPGTSGEGWWEAQFSRPLINPSARTGIVTARLTAVDVETTVVYDGVGYNFDNILAYEPIGKPGSSGSIVGHIDTQNETFHPVGLHFAGSDARSIAIPYSSIRAEHGPLTPDTGTPTVRTIFEDEPSFFEATPITRRQGAESTVRICLTNLGYAPSPGDSKQVQITDSEGAQLASTGVVLTSGEVTFEEFDIGTLSPGSHTLSLSTPDVEETWTLFKYRATEAVASEAVTTSDGSGQTDTSGVVVTNPS